MNKKQSAAKKRYQREIKKLREEIRKWRRHTKKGSTLADMKDTFARQMIVGLKQDLAEAKKMLKLYTKN